MGKHGFALALGVVSVGACGVDPATVSWEHDRAHASLDAGGFGFDGGWACDFCDAGATTKVVTSAIQPTFLPTTVATVPPPAISGGTLIVTRDGHYAIAADPDRDLVYGVDLTTNKLAYSVQLEGGDEPGRVTEDGSGRVHIALRKGGALVTLDETNGSSIARRSVCPAPRGVSWDASTDLVWVACATGELVAFPAGGGAATQSYVVERDLRDVIASNGALSVSKFRSAEVLRLGASGSVARRDTQPATNAVAPHVAWRMVPGSLGSVVVVHQVESLIPIPTHQSRAYGGGCNGEGPPLPPANMPTFGDAGTSCGNDLHQNFWGVGCDEQPGAVASAVTILASDGSVITDRMFPASLPVDVAVSRDGGLAAIAAGDAFANIGSVYWFNACGDFSRPPARLADEVGDHVLYGGRSVSRQPIAVAFGATNDLIVQLREPAEIWIFDAVTKQSKTRIALSSVSRDDTGHDVFHTQAGAMIACASCHPEGGDDGHTWMLDGAPRRTPSLRGTVEGTAPYHWPGDQPTLDALVDDVYTTRMSGKSLPTDQKAVLEAWVKHIPAPPAPSWVDGAAAQRGQAIFTATDVGCSGCHSGAKLTNNATMNVGTGSAFQVPPLVGVGWRTPLLHDGCAATLADRFGKCATSTHGSIGNLSAANIADLVSYLETL